MNANNSDRQKPIAKSQKVTIILAILLFLMIVIFVLQWYAIRGLLGVSVDLLETELIQQAPTGVDKTEVQQTFTYVKKAVSEMPFSYLTGKVNLKKAKTAADYALRANSDGVWSAEEINTLLKMTNAAVGYKRGTNNE